MYLRAHSSVIPGAKMALEIFGLFSPLIIHQIFGGENNLPFVESFNSSCLNFFFLMQMR